MNRSYIFLILALFCQILAGCASTQNQAGSVKTGSASSFDLQAFETGLVMEQDLRLVEAKKQYQLALAANPSNPEAALRLEQLNKRLKNLAEQHYQKSLRQRHNGKYELALRYLRIALRLWPDHESARVALENSSQTVVSKFIWHTIGKGESLSLISKAYYGSFRPSEKLAQVNRIKDASKIRIGMKIKIPQLKEYPFIQDKAGMIVALEHEQISGLPAEPEVDPLDIYRGLGIEFFESKEYKSAVTEFQKALTIAPQDPSATNYILKAYTHLGLSAMGNKQFLSAMDYFSTGLSVSSSCPACKKGLKNSRGQYMEQHYRMGMKHFDAQKLDLAITEWTRVSKIDPGYKKTAELLEKAKTIKKNVEALKRKK